MSYSQWLYVDDALFFARDKTKINEVVDNLKKMNPKPFLLNDEDDLAGFLGILMEMQDDGLTELKQTGLIDRILKVMELERCKREKDSS